MLAGKTDYSGDSNLLGQSVSAWIRGELANERADILADKDISDSKIGK